MKRSEMIGKMMSVLINQNTPEHQIDRNEAKRISEIILEMQVKEGMLPPFTYLKSLGTLDTAWEPEE